MEVIIRNITLHRGDYKEFTFKLFGDYTSHKLYFTVKADRVLTSVRYIDLANTLGGGSDTQIKATYDGTYTTITVFIQPLHTQNLTQKQLVYDIVADDGSEPVTLFDGYFNLDFDVRSPYDNTVVPSEQYYNQIFDRAYIAKVSSAGSLTEITDQGYNATVSATRLSEGMYKITSDVDLFDTSTYTTILKFTPLNINASNTVLNALPVFNHNLGFNAKELVIGITNLNDGGVIDCEFILEVYRVRK